MIIGVSSSNSPVYLRDLVDISRSYQSPPTFLNYLTWQDASGQWYRSRAITLGVNMRSGQQIDLFGQHVQEKLDSIHHYLPDDLVIVPTSSQPVQVKEQIDLFMDALYEAIGLVVIVSLIGFWEWRSAVLMAISIPITLAMTFGTMYVLGIDIQQVSVASLIIALGLLVDDPVVAGDSIKRMLAEGQPRIVAPWLGPTKIATAILYATITNIVAYLPFLLITGTTGEFIFSLPVVMTVALVSSRLASMTFIPLLGYYLLRPGQEAGEDDRGAPHYGLHGTICGCSKVCHRASLEGRTHFAAVPGVRRLHFLAAEDIVLPRRRAVLVVRGCLASQRCQLRRHQHGCAAGGADHSRASRVMGQEASGEGWLAGAHLEVRDHLGGRRQPRFWFSASPQPKQLNYAQVLVQLTNKDLTPDFVDQVQPILSARSWRACAAITGSCKPIPSITRWKSASSARPTSAPTRARRTSPRCAVSRARWKTSCATAPEADRVRNEWQKESFQVSLNINPDRANLAGITNLDVANSATSAMSGTPVTTLQDGRQEHSRAGALADE